MQRGFVVSEFFSIHFTTTGLTNIECLRYMGGGCYIGVRYTDVFVKKEVCQGRIQKIQQEGAQKIGGGAPPPPRSPNEKFTFVEMLLSAF